MFAVRVANLIKTYDSRCVFDGVNLDVHDGEFYALMDPDGSGKTTLASIIAAVEMASRGIVEVH